MTIASIMAEYCEIGSDESLPLGEEFQEHIKCFIKTDKMVIKITKEYELVAKIIEQLGWVWQRIHYTHTIWKRYVIFSIILFEWLIGLSRQAV